MNIPYTHIYIHIPKYILSKSPYVYIYIHMYISIIYPKYIPLLMLVMEQILHQLMVYPIL